MKICVFGAGAIGGYIAAHLARVPGVETSVIARGAHLAAIQANGLTVRKPDGDFNVRLRATDDPRELGPQDYLFLTVKLHQLDAALPTMLPLLGAETAVLQNTTTMPYWYFHGDRRFPERQLEALDPGARQWRTLGPQRAIGSVYFISADMPAPGEIRLNSRLGQLPLGEPDGAPSMRILRLADALSRGGIAAPVKDDIRSWIWFKANSSLCGNTIALLTGATLRAVCEDPAARQLFGRIVDEASTVAAAFGAVIPRTTEEYISSIQSNPHHRMSVLQDLESNRPLEIEALVEAFNAMRDLTDVKTPLLDVLTPLAALRAQQHARSLRA